MNRTLDGVIGDPSMQAWIDALLAEGWRIQQVEDDANVVVLDWPPMSRLPAIVEKIEVPLRVDGEDYQLRYAWMSDMLGGICALAARIRAAEQSVYAEHVAHGWRRERPIRWTREEWNA